MERGYSGYIGNEFVFVVAKNIEEATSKFIEKANGQKWEFDSTRHYKVIQ